MLTHHELTELLLDFAGDVHAAFDNTAEWATLVSALTGKIMSAEEDSYHHAYELGHDDGAAGYTTNEPDTTSALIDERMDRNAERQTLVQEVAERQALVREAARQARPFSTPEAFYPTLPEPTGFHGLTVPNADDIPTGYVNPA